jgi:signal transduction histidine kinase
MHRRIAGEVAAEIARQLADPIRALRDRLGLVVDHIERHVAQATGPTPYPWRSLQTLRQDLGATYLEATTLARRIDELDQALGGASGELAAFDLSAAVDHGIRLASHNIASGMEVLIDLGDLPHVRGVAGTLALVVAQLIALSADSARGLPNSTLSVRTWDEDGTATLAIIDNGAGNDRAVELGDLVRQVMTPWGAEIDATSEQGHGCAFEIRLTTA